MRDDGQKQEGKAGGSRAGPHVASRAGVGNTATSLHTARQTEKHTTPVQTGASHATRNPGSAVLRVASASRLDFEGSVEGSERPRWRAAGRGEGAGKASEEGERGGDARRASERRGKASEARQGERGEARRARRGKAREARRASRRGEQGEARRTSRPVAVEAR